MSPDTSQPQTGLTLREKVAVALHLTEFCPEPDPGVCSCDLDDELRWADAVIPLIAADVQQRIAVALDQRKSDPRYGAALFVQRLDLNLSEAPR